MSLKRWISFWEDYAENNRDASDQVQVLRTFEKKPIDLISWEKTLKFVRMQIAIHENHDLLELCCGNGLFTRNFAPSCRSVFSVDVAEPLIQNLKALQIKNVEALCMNVMELDFKQKSFDRILIYAGIQYFSLKETIELLSKCSLWLRKGGILYIGDIPDASRLWSFYNTPERVRIYFDNLKKDADFVGTWFDPGWLTKLGESLELNEIQIISQPSYQIYSHFRFDVKWRK